GYLVGTGPGGGSRRFGGVHEAPDLWDRGRRRTGGGEGESVATCPCRRDSIGFGPARVDQCPGGCVEHAPAELVEDRGRCEEAAGKLERKTPERDLGPPCPLEVKLEGRRLDRARPSRCERLAHDPEWDDTAPAPVHGSNGDGAVLAVHRDLD